MVHLLRETTFREKRL